MKLENGPNLALRRLNSPLRSRNRDSSIASPRDVWSGRSSFSPGVCVTLSANPWVSLSLSRRRTSSCMSAALDENLLAAPRAAMLSVSTRTVLPRSRPPPTSHTRTMPNSSRQLIGRRRSACVKLREASSRAPSSHSTWPVPQLLASVPVSTASAASPFPTRGAKLRWSRWPCHHRRSRQKAGDTSRSRHPAEAGFTCPRCQSTTSPLNWLSMPCMYVRPPLTTWETKTSLPKKLASALGSATRSPSPGSSASHASISETSLARRFRVIVMPLSPSVLQIKSPRNSMHRHGPRFLCGAH